MFTSLRSGVDEGYEEVAGRMIELASKQPGFLGVESVRSPDGFGITISYWASEEAIVDWRNDLEHKAAQNKGRDVWYSDYQLRVAKVERDYGKSGRPDTA